MIIRQMRATFGKLDGRVLRLQPGLNVISGANETGKSTWLAFLMAMLYGVDTKGRARGDQLPDKIKYQPWSGKPMAGAMELEVDGRSVTLERTSETSPMGAFRAWDTETGSALQELTGKTCGQTLLGVEAAVYARSGCLRQQRIPISADPRLEKRLSGLVTTATEDYSCAEIDEKLKKLQTAIRHNRSGALPEAEENRKKLLDQLREIGESQRSLAELEAELSELRLQREKDREILAGLKNLDRSERLERVSAAEDALVKAREDREGWESVCADLPGEAVLQELESELHQIQTELQRVALPENQTAPEQRAPEQDPVFRHMSAREAHDKAAADATVVQDARNAEEPRKRRTLYGLLLLLAGLAAGIAGAVLSVLPLMVCGAAALVGGAGWMVWTGISFKRQTEAYLAQQREARRILKLYEAESAKGVVLRGLQYIHSLEKQEAEALSGQERRLEALAERRKAVFDQLEELMPGSGTPEKAAALFQEASRARQELSRARLMERQWNEQLNELRFSLGSDTEEIEHADRFVGCDRQAVAEELQSLEERIAVTASRADKLSGAIGQMGDPLALNAEAEGLTEEIRRLKERYAALKLARKALTEADEALRAKLSPLLCQKTGELFFRLTCGRYDAVRLDRSLRVTVHPAGSPVYRPLSYLSGGTVDQLYLALRLAICELLLPAAPIILDDAFVFFDDKRAAQALETLRDLSKTRQILLFTSQSREKRILDELARNSKAEAPVQSDTVS